MSLPPVALHLDLVRAGRGANASSPKKNDTKIAMHQCIFTNPPSIAPLHLAWRSLVHENSNLAQGKKPLELHEITNTPRPVLSSALNQQENRAHEHHIH